MRHIRNLIAPTTYHREADGSGISYHVLGERPIHSVSAKFRFGAICESFTRFSVGVLVTAGVVVNILCSKPLRHCSHCRHEYASHLTPTRSPTLTGESVVCAPIATISPTPS